MAKCRALCVREYAHSLHGDTADSVLVDTHPTLCHTPNHTLTCFPVYPVVLSSSAEQQSAVSCLHMNVQMKKSFLHEVCAPAFNEGHERSLEKMRGDVRGREKVTV